MMIDDPDVIVAHQDDDSFPRPYRTLLFSGWKIDHGQVAHEGFIRVSKSANPEGDVVIQSCTFTNNKLPSTCTTAYEVAATLLCVCVMSRADIEDLLASESDEIGETP